MSIRRILFPTDLTEEAETAKAFALSLARQHDAEVLFYHAVLTHADAFRQIGDLLSDFLDKLEKEAGQKLAEETRGLNARGRRTRYVVEQQTCPFEAIMDQVRAYAPDLIVMATHGRRGMPRWFLGSVAEKVVRHAPCSVATVRPSEAPPGDGGPIERLLVPVDFSDDSRRAVAIARALLAEGGKLTLLHVVPNPTLAGLAPEAYLRLFTADPSLPDRIRERMSEWAADSMKERLFEVEVTEADDVAQSILDVAEDKKVAAIVMGTRGSTGLEYLLTGSVADKVVRSSPIPVVTVK